MEGHPKWLFLAIPLLYKHGDNQRVRIENLTIKNRESWMEYIKCERGEYKRYLFRRVVEYDWNKKDMKMWFQLWMEFEKKENGDLEEVRSRAKEYIEKLKGQGSVVNGT